MHNAIATANCRYCCFCQISEHPRCVKLAIATVAVVSPCLLTVMIKMRIQRLHYLCSKLVIRMGQPVSDLSCP